MPNPIIDERHYRTTLAKDAPTKLYHRYWCPGCDTLHQITINPDKNGLGAGWDFTGTLEKPTYQPSQLTTWGGPVGQPERRCHTFIKDGQIQFLTDSTHELAGQTVPLPPLPDWVVIDSEDEE